MKKRVLIITLLAAATTAVMALPAKRGAIYQTDADGIEHEVYLHGDAFFHYMTDAEGQWLDEETYEALSEEKKAARIQAGIARKQRRIEQQQESVGDLNLAPRGLIILINFADVQFKTEHCEIQNMLNGEYYERHYDYNYRYNGRPYKGHVDHYGSARKYFETQSDSAYLPQFDVIGPVNATHEMAYYGKNDDANVGKLIKEACEEADKWHKIDFTKYDNDDDGNVDFVYVIYAGYGEADGGGTNTIWPHNYDLRYTGTSCKVDGLNIRNYACSNELNYTDKQYAGPGTFCHEFSHVLGLPDLYETNQNSLGLHTLLDWDILDYGPYNNEGNTPPGYSAYERFYMGWLTPRVLTEPASEVWLGVLSEMNDAILLCEGDEHNLVGANPNPRTFYMLENRQNQWGWDRFLPGNGMLITKIQYSPTRWANNSVNNSASNMGVDLIEAQENTSNYSAPTDAYPAGATEWTDFADHEITNIVQTDGLDIFFSYRWLDREGIENVRADEDVQKIIRDGQMLIIRNGVTYNAQGAIVR